MTKRIRKQVSIKEPKILAAAKKALESRYGDRQITDAQTVHICLSQCAILNSNPNIAAFDQNVLLQTLKQKCVSATIANTIEVLKIAGVDATVEYSPDGASWFLIIKKTDETVRHLIASEVEFDDLSGEFQKMGKTIEIDKNGATIN